ncbi:MAG: hypothetical protein ACM3OG_07370 [Actinomycetota bacterium]
MAVRPPRIKDILSGIILLAGMGRKPIPLAAVHSIIHAMKPHESILSGLRFSLTGAVCYSRDIDQALDCLADAGYLRVVGGAILAGENADAFGGYLSGFLTNSQIQAVHSASLRFHERARREARDPMSRM